LLFDVDGTLAPIVPIPEAAEVPEGTRALLRMLESRYALVACISGRRAEDARRIVGVDSLACVGNHGLEFLPSGAPSAELLSSAADGEAVRTFAHQTYDSDVQDAGVRLEDKGPISSFHWREAPDEAAAHAALTRIAALAAERGLVPHWGRKVLEIRPPVAVDKGTAVTTVLEGADEVERALYVGDDSTDVDAFRALRQLESTSRLERAICVGVRSAEAPDEVIAEADLVVEGPSGVVELMSFLAG
jgi:trehalose 6-phosphate phosphatase